MNKFLKTEASPCCNLPYKPNLYLFTKWKKNTFLNSQQKPSFLKFHFYSYLKNNRTTLKSLECLTDEEVGGIFYYNWGLVMQVKRRIKIDFKDSSKDYHLEVLIASKFLSCLEPTS